MGSFKNGKLKPWRELPLHASFLAEHLALADLSTQPVHTPVQVGLVKFTWHSSKNLCWGLIGLPHASYVTNTSSISRDISSNCRVPSFVLKSVRPPEQTALCKSKRTGVSLTRKKDEYSYAEGKSTYPFWGVNVHSSATSMLPSSNFS